MWLLSAAAGAGGDALSFLSGEGSKSLKGNERDEDEAPPLVLSSTSDESLAKAPGRGDVSSLESRSNSRLESLDGAKTGTADSVTSRIDRTDSTGSRVTETTATPFDIWGVLLGVASEGPHTGNQKAPSIVEDSIESGEADKHVGPSTDRASIPSKAQESDAADALAAAGVQEGEDDKQQEAGTEKVKKKKKKKSAEGKEKASHTGKEQEAELLASEERQNSISRVGGSAATGDITAVAEANPDASADVPSKGFSSLAAGVAAFFGGAAAPAAADDSHSPTATATPASETAGAAAESEPSSSATGAPVSEKVARGGTLELEHRSASGGFATPAAFLRDSSASLGAAVVGGSFSSSPASSDEGGGAAPLLWKYLVAPAARLGESSDSSSTPNVRQISDEQASGDSLVLKGATGALATGLEALSVEPITGSTGGQQAEASKEKISESAAGTADNVITAIAAATEVTAEGRDVITALGEATAQRGVAEGPAAQGEKAKEVSERPPEGVGAPLKRRKTRKAAGLAAIKSGGAVQATDESGGTTSEVITNEQPAEEQGKKRKSLLRKKSTKKADKSAEKITEGGTDAVKPEEGDIYDLKASGGRNDGEGEELAHREKTLEGEDEQREGRIKPLREDLNEEAEIEEEKDGRRRGRKSKKSGGADVGPETEEEQAKGDEKVAAGTAGALKRRKTLKRITLSVEGGETPPAEQAAEKEKPEDSPVEAPRKEEGPTGSFSNSQSTPSIVIVAAPMSLPESLEGEDLSPSAAGAVAANGLSKTLPQKSKPGSPPSTLAELLKKVSGASKNKYLTPNAAVKADKDKDSAGAIYLLNKAAAKSGLPRGKPLPKPKPPLSRGPSSGTVSTNRVSDSVSAATNGDAAERVAKEGAAASAATSGTGEGADVLTGKRNNTAAAAEARTPAGGAGGAAKDSHAAAAESGGGAATESGAAAKADAGPTGDVDVSIAGETPGAAASSGATPGVERSGDVAAAASQIGEEAAAASAGASAEKEGVASAAGDDATASKRSDIGGERFVDGEGKGDDKAESGESVASSGQAGAAADKRTAPTAEPTPPEASEMDVARILAAENQSPISDGENAQGAAPVEEPTRASDKSGEAGAEAAAPKESAHAMKKTSIKPKPPFPRTPLTERTDAGEKKAVETMTAPQDKDEDLQAAKEPTKGDQGMLSQPDDVTAPAAVTGGPNVKEPNGTAEIQKEKEESIEEASLSAAADDKLPTSATTPPKMSVLTKVGGKDFPSLPKVHPKKMAPLTKMPPKAMNGSAKAPAQGKTDEGGTISNGTEAESVGGAATTTQAAPPATAESEKETVAAPATADKADAGESGVDGIAKEASVDGASTAEKNRATAATAEEAKEGAPSPADAAEKEATRLDTGADTTAPAAVADVGVVAGTAEELTKGTTGPPNVKEDDTHTAATTGTKTAPPFPPQGKRKQSPLPKPPPRGYVTASAAAAEAQSGDDLSGTFTAVKKASLEVNDAAGREAAPSVQLAAAAKHAATAVEPTSRSAQEIPSGSGEKRPTAGDDIRGGGRTLKEGPEPSLEGTAAEATTEDAVKGEAAAAQNVPAERAKEAPQVVEEVASALNVSSEVPEEAPGATADRGAAQDTTETNIEEKEQATRDDVLIVAKVDAGVPGKRPPVKAKAGVPALAEGKFSASTSKEEAAGDAKAAQEGGEAGDATEVAADSGVKGGEEAAEPASVTAPTEAAGEAAGGPETEEVGEKPEADKGGEVAPTETTTAARIEEGAAKAKAAAPPIKTRAAPPPVKRGPGGPPIKFKGPIQPKKMTSPGDAKVAQEGGEAGDATEVAADSGVKGGEEAAEPASATAPTEAAGGTVAGPETEEAGEKPKADKGGEAAPTDTTTVAEMDEGAAKAKAAAPPIKTKPAPPPVRRGPGGPPIKFKGPIQPKKMTSPGDAKVAQEGGEAGDATEVAADSGVKGGEEAAEPASVTAPTEAAGGTAGGPETEEEGKEPEADKGGEAAPTDTTTVAEMDEGAAKVKAAAPQIKTKAAPPPVRRGPGGPPIKFKGPIQPKKMTSPGDAKVAQEGGEAGDATEVAADSGVKGGEEAAEPASVTAPTDAAGGAAGCLETEEEGEKPEADKGGEAAPTDTTTAAEIDEGAVKVKAVAAQIKTRAAPPPVKRGPGGPPIKFKGPVQSKKMTSPGDAKVAQEGGEAGDATEVAADSGVKGGEEAAEPASVTAPTEAAGEAAGGPETEEVGEKPEADKGGEVAPTETTTAAEMDEGAARLKAVAPPIKTRAAPPPVKRGPGGPPIKFKGPIQPKKMTSPGDAKVAQEGGEAGDATEVAADSGVKGGEEAAEPASATAPTEAAGGTVAGPETEEAGEKPKADKGGEAAPTDTTTVAEMDEGAAKAKAAAPPIKTKPAPPPVKRGPGGPPIKFKGPIQPKKMTSPGDAKVAQEGGEAGDATEVAADSGVKGGEEAAEPASVTAPTEAAGEAAGGPETEEVGEKPKADKGGEVAPTETTTAAEMDEGVDRLKAVAPPIKTRAAPPPVKRGPGGPPIKFKGPIQPKKMTSPGDAKVAQEGGEAGDATEVAADSGVKGGEEAAEPASVTAPTDAAGGAAAGPETEEVGEKPEADKGGEAAPTDTTTVAEMDEGAAKAKAVAAQIKTRAAPPPVKRGPGGPPIKFKGPIQPKKMTSPGDAKVAQEGGEAGDAAKVAAADSGVMGGKDATKEPERASVTAEAKESDVVDASAATEAARGGPDARVAAGTKAVGEKLDSEQGEAVAREADTGSAVNVQAGGATHTETLPISLEVRLPIKAKPASALIKTKGVGPPLPKKALHGIKQLSLMKGVTVAGAKNTSGEVAAAPTESPSLAESELPATAVKTMQTAESAENTKEKEASEGSKKEGAGEKAKSHPSAVGGEAKTTFGLLEATMKTAEAKKYSPATEIADTASPGAAGAAAGGPSIVSGAALPSAAVGVSSTKSAVTGPAGITKDSGESGKRASAAGEAISDSAQGKHEGVAESKATGHPTLSTLPKSEALQQPSKDTGGPQPKGGAAIASDEEKPTIADSKATAVAGVSAPKPKPGLPKFPAKEVTQPASAAVSAAETAGPSSSTQIAALHAPVSVREDKRDEEALMKQGGDAAAGAAGKTFPPPSLVSKTKSVPPKPLGPLPKVAQSPVAGPVALKEAPGVVEAISKNAVPASAPPVATAAESDVDTTKVVSKSTVVTTSEAAAVTDAAAVHDAATALPEAQVDISAAGGENKLDAVVSSDAQRTTSGQVLTDGETKTFTTRETTPPATVRMFPVRLVKKYSPVLPVAAAEDETAVFEKAQLDVLRAGTPVLPWHKTPERSARSKSGPQQLQSAGDKQQPQHPLSTQQQEEAPMQAEQPNEGGEPREVPAEKLLSATVKEGRGGLSAEESPKQGPFMPVEKRVADDEKPLPDEEQHNAVVAAKQRDVPPPEALNDIPAPIKPGREKASFPPRVDVLAASGAVAASTAEDLPATTGAAPAAASPNTATTPTSEVPAATAASLDESAAEQEGIQTAAHEEFPVGAVNVAAGQAFSAPTMNKEAGPSGPSVAVSSVRTPSKVSLESRGAVATGISKEAPGMGKEGQGPAQQAAEQGTKLAVKGDAAPMFSGKTEINVKNGSEVPTSMLGTETALKAGDLPALSAVVGAGAAGLPVGVVEETATIKASEHKTGGIVAAGAKAKAPPTNAPLSGEAPVAKPGQKATTDTEAVDKGLSMDAARELPTPTPEEAAGEEQAEARTFRLPSGVKVLPALVKGNLPTPALGPSASSETKVAAAPAPTQEQQLADASSGSLPWAEGEERGAVTSEAKFSGAAQTAEQTTPTARPPHPPSRIPLLQKKAIAPTATTCKAASLQGHKKTPPPTAAVLEKLPAKAFKQSPLAAASHAPQFPSTSSGKVEAGTAAAASLVEVSAAKAIEAPKVTAGVAGEGLATRGSALSVAPQGAARSAGEGGEKLPTLPASSAAAPGPCDVAAATVPDMKAVAVRTHEAVAVVKRDRGDIGGDVGGVEPDDKLQGVPSAPSSPYATAVIAAGAPKGKVVPAAAIVAAAHQESVAALTVSAKALVDGKAYIGGEAALPVSREVHEIHPIVAEREKAGPVLKAEEFKEVLGADHTHVATAGDGSAAVRLLEPRVGTTHYGAAEFDAAQKMSIATTGSVAAVTASFTGVQPPEDVAAQLTDGPTYSGPSVFVQEGSIAENDKSNGSGQMTWRALPRATPPIGHAAVAVTVVGAAAEEASRVAKRGQISSTDREPATPTFLGSRIQEAAASIQRPLSVLGGSLEADANGRKLQQAILTEGRLEAGDTHKDRESSAARQAYQGGTVRVDADVGDSSSSRLVLLALQGVAGVQETASGGGFIASMVTDTQLADTSGTEEGMRLRWQEICASFPDLLYMMKALALSSDLAGTLTTGSCVYGVGPKAAYVAAAPICTTRNLANSSYSPSAAILAAARATAALPPKVPLLRNQPGAPRVTALVCSGRPADTISCSLEEVAAAGRASEALQGLQGVSSVYTAPSIKYYKQYPLREDGGGKEDASSPRFPTNECRVGKEPASKLLFDVGLKAWNELQLTQQPQLVLVQGEYLTVADMTAPSLVQEVLVLGSPSFNTNDALMNYIRDSYRVLRSMGCLRRVDKNALLPHAAAAAMIVQQWKVFFSSSQGSVAGMQLVAHLLPATPAPLLSYDLLLRLIAGAAADEEAMLGGDPLFQVIGAAFYQELNVLGLHPAQRKLILVECLELLGRVLHLPPKQVLCVVMLLLGAACLQQLSFGYSDKLLHAAALLLGVQEQQLFLLLCSRDTHVPDSQCSSYSSHPSITSADGSAEFSRSVCCSTATLLYRCMFGFFVERINCQLRHRKALLLLLPLFGAPSLELPFGVSVFTPPCAGQVFAYAAQTLAHMYAFKQLHALRRLLREEKFQLPLYLQSLSSSSSSNSTGLRNLYVVQPQRQQLEEEAAGEAFWGAAGPDSRFEGFVAFLAAGPRSVTEVAAWLQQRTATFAADNSFLAETLRILPSGNVTEVRMHAQTMHVPVVELAAASVPPDGNALHLFSNMLHGGITLQEFKSGAQGLSIPPLSSVSDARHMFAALADVLCPFHAVSPMLLHRDYTGTHTFADLDALRNWEAYGFPLFVRIAELPVYCPNLFPPAVAEQVDYLKQVLLLYIKKEDVLFGRSFLALRSVAYERLQSLQLKAAALIRTRQQQLQKLCEQDPVACAMAEKLMVQRVAELKPLQQHRSEQTKQPPLMHQQAEHRSAIVPPLPAPHHRVKVKSKLWCPPRSLSKASVK